MDAIIKPKALKPGDNLRLVSPASPITPEKVQAFSNLIDEAGYDISLADHVFEVDEYLAGPDKHRAEDLQRAFADERAQAVMCTRGGYGAARLMPYLDFDAMANSGKMFLGFSDITTLHIALNRRGLVTFHAPMALSLSVQREPWVYESFLNCLKGDNPIPEAAPKGKCMVPGVAEGIVTGGCLCLLTDSIATANPLDCEGKLLLIEDVDENPHRIDAMLTHLILTGMIQSAAGLIIGEMTGSDEKYDPTIGGKPWLEIVRDRVAALGVPTIVNFPFGHCKNMLTLPLGIRARMDAEAGTLTYLESSCA